MLKMKGPNTKPCGYLETVYMRNLVPEQPVLRSGLSNFLARPMVWALLFSKSVYMKILVLARRSQISRPPF